MLGHTPSALEQRDELPVRERQRQRRKREQPPITNDELAPAALAAIDEPMLGFDVGVLKRQSFLISAVMLGGLLVLLVIASLVPTKYTASAKLEVLFAPDWRSAGTSISDPRQVQMVIDKHLIMLKSRALLESVYQASGAMSDPTLDSSSWSGSQPNDTATRLEKFERMIAVNQLLSSSIIAIQYTSSNPELAAAVANTLVQSYLDRSLNRQRAELENELDRIKERLAELDRSLQHVRARAVDPSATIAASDTPAMQSNANRNEPDEAVTRQLITELTQKQDEMRRRYEGLESEVRIAALAPVPVQPSSLSPAFLFLPGVLLLIAGATFLALLRERLDGSIRTTNQAAEVLGIPCPCAIPDFKALGVANPLTVLKDEPRSRYSESIRMLAARLSLIRSSSQPEVIFVTSCEAGAGKSTLTAGLAQYLSLIGRRVVVIDLDWRKNGLIEGALPAPTRGVPCLRDLADRNDLVPRHHPSLEFDYVPASATSGDPLMHVTGDGFASALGILRTRYDVIFIDGSSIEAEILAALADRFLIALRCGSTKATAARLSLSTLRSLSGPRTTFAAVVTHDPVDIDWYRAAAEWLRAVHLRVPATIRNALSVRT